MNIKPKLRNSAYYDMRSFINGAIERAISDNNEYPFQSCISCILFDKSTEICKIANRRPPAIVIVHGCPEYDDEQAPPF